MIQGEILQNRWSGFGGIQDRFESILPPMVLGTKQRYFVRLSHI